MIERGVVGWLFPTPPARLVRSIQSPCCRMTMRRACRKRRGNDKFCGLHLAHSTASPLTEPAIRDQWRKTPRSPQSTMIKLLKQTYISPAHQSPRVGTLGPLLEAVNSHGMAMLLAQRDCPSMKPAVTTRDERPCSRLHERRSCYLWSTYSSPLPIAAGSRC